MAAWIWNYLKPSQGELFNLIQTRQLMSQCPVSPILLQDCQRHLFFRITLSFDIVKVNNWPNGYEEKNILSRLFWITKPLLMRIYYANLRIYAPLLFCGLLSRLRTVYNFDCLPYLFVRNVTNTSSASCLAKSSVVPSMLRRNTFPKFRTLDIVCL